MHFPSTLLSSTSPEFFSMQNPAGLFIQAINLGTWDMYNKVKENLTAQQDSK